MHHRHFTLEHPAKFLSVDSSEVYRVRNIHFNYPLRYREVADLARIQNHPRNARACFSQARKENPEELVVVRVSPFNTSRWARTATTLDSQAMLPLELAETTLRVDYLTEVIEQIHLVNPSSPRSRNLQKEAVVSRVGISRVL